MKRRVSSAAAAVAAASIALLSGCLSVCRFGKCDSASAKEWSEERQAWVRVETCRTGGDRDICAKYGLYPTMKMRWQLLRVSCHWAPKRNWWGQRVGTPLGLLALTPGILVDLPIDTLALPWDWKHRHNVSPDMCAPLDEERAYRSFCVICGATSDGEFARCRKYSDRNTADWNRYYGVCPGCIKAAKDGGYYFQ